MFLDGKSHIFVCVKGHRWESGDAWHHPKLPWRGYRCPHCAFIERNLTTTSCAVRMRCPPNCPQRTDETG